MSLGYRELQPHPFDKCMEKHPVGSTVVGKVISVLPYGAFVEIEPGVEGLVHVSEAAATYVKDINEVLHAGDEVKRKSSCLRRTAPQNDVEYPRMLGRRKACGKDDEVG